MKVQNWYDVECSICGKHLCDFNSDMQRSKTLAISNARLLGWTYINGKNICPDCKK
jgi:hypothetical protein